MADRQDGPDADVATLVAVIREAFDYAPLTSNRLRAARSALDRLQHELVIVAEQADRALKSAIAWEKQARLSEAEVQRLQQTPDYARNPDGSYVTPEQTDEGWAVQ